jgi:hypothetical protein
MQSEYTLGRISWEIILRNLFFCKISSAYFSGVTHDHDMRYKKIIV